MKAISSVDRGTSHDGDGVLLRAVGVVAALSLAYVGLLALVLAVAS